MTSPTRLTPMFRLGELYFERDAIRQQDEMNDVPRRARPAPAAGESVDALVEPQEGLHAATIQLYQQLVIERFPNYAKHRRRLLPDRLLPQRKWAQPEKARLARGSNDGVRESTSTFAPRCEDEPGKKLADPKAEREAEEPRRSSIARASTSSRRRSRRSPRPIYGRCKPKTVESARFCGGDLAAHRRVPLRLRHQSPRAWTTPSARTSTCLGDAGRPQLQPRPLQGGMDRTTARSAIPKRIQ